MNFNVDHESNEDGFGMLPVSESNKSQQNRIVRTLMSVSKKEVSRFKLVLLCYKTIVWFMVLAVSIDGWMRAYVLIKHIKCEVYLKKRSNLSLMKAYYITWHKQKQDC